MTRLPLPSPVRKALMALVAVGLVAGCSPDDAGRPQETATTTALMITVTVDDGAEPTVMKLRCDPVGGDHPDAAAACAKLATTGADVFEPVPADQVCTMIFGGPQTATIIGTYQGKKVDASFNRKNGCEIDRWDSLGTEVFDVPLEDRGCGSIR